ncbi:MAG: hypothetical protein D6820_17635 [Lentisphaerae bacterium]|nr:MAG: hypothetical protein D6820_17635 [Lentisphaerota bacterium]
MGFKWSYGRWGWISGKSLVIVAVFSVYAGIMCWRHDIFEEMDGVIQYFAGREIISLQGYRGWASYFWPPLYPLLLGLGACVFSGFVAGKLISLLAGIATLFVAYYLYRELCGDEDTALGAQLLLAVNPIFVCCSIQAENHMLDTFFYVSALWIMLKISGETDWRRLRNQALLLGLFSGLACLSRYTSYSLIPVIMLLCLFLVPYRRCLWYFLLAFVMVESPWWLYNTLVNGSPLFTMQYVNVGTGVFNDDMKWWWYDHVKFSGVLDIFFSYPGLYMRNYRENVIESLILIRREMAVLAPVLEWGFAYALLRLEQRRVGIVMAAMTAYVVLVSQAFVFAEVFLSWVVVLQPFCVMAIREYWLLFGHRWLKWPARAVVVKWGILFSLAFLALASFNRMHDRVQGYLARDGFDDGQTVRTHEVARALRQYDPQIETKYVMSISPSRAYYAGSRWLLVPYYYEGNIDGLVCYRGLDPRVKRFAPKYPTQSDAGNLCADYLVCDLSFVGHLPQFRFMLNPKSPEIPSHFKPIFISREVVVYHIMHGAMHCR